MSFKVLKSFILCLFISTSLMAKESDFISGLKWPNSKLSDDTVPVKTLAIRPSQESYRGGFNDLLPYIMKSPYQDNAGSCLFMSHTGIVEWWMNRIYDTDVFDLSERFYMNLMKDDIGDELMENWRTDTIFRANKMGHFYFNRDFPFTKGWYKYIDGTRVPAKENEEDAYYGTSFNWVVMLDDIQGYKLEIPKFKRNVIFSDPEENQWNVNVAPEDIVSRVKKAITKNKAPVLVIYNHMGFWHANIIVGFNDNASTKGCPFVSKFKEVMFSKAQGYLEEAATSTDPKEQRRLERKAARYKRRGTNVHDEFLKRGGCSDKGVFYVRDSIYPDKNEPLYDFDPSKEGEEEHYNGKVILREYEWLERVSNHAIQILI